jgi:hypothetical protein
MLHTFVLFCAKDGGEIVGHGFFFGGRAAGCERRSLVIPSKFDILGLSKNRCGCYQRRYFAAEIWGGDDERQNEEGRRTAKASGNMSWRKFSRNGAS